MHLRYDYTEGKINMGVGVDVHMPADAPDQAKALEAQALDGEARREYIRFAHDSGALNVTLGGKPVPEVQYEAVFAVLSEGSHGKRFVDAVRSNTLFPSIYIASVGREFPRVPVTAVAGEVERVGPVVPVAAAAASR